MRVTRSRDIAAEPMEAANFSGSASRRDLGRIEELSAAPIVVRFEAGGRTNWHRHAGGQVLFVLEGRGRVGARGAATAELEPGDFVYAPAGEEHWHGAAEGASMSHVALSFGETEWSGPVDD